ncbi:MAG: hypothetical protein AB1646_13250 [Thermodesulfobacteriota bacterium]
MKTYRFVTTTHHDVLAETLEEAIKAFNEIKRGGLSPEVDAVTGIEVENETGQYMRVDRPLRGGDLDARREAPAH